MSSKSTYNKNNSGVKRIMAEARELQRDSSTEYIASPLEAPSIMLLTPNGRFELNKKICISFTAYHEDQWQPSWGVRTAIIGLQSFFPLKGEDASGVGGIEVPVPERKRLATLSRHWVCSQCKQSNAEALQDSPPIETSSASGQASGELIEKADTCTPIPETALDKEELPPAKLATEAATPETPALQFTKEASVEEQGGAVALVPVAITKPPSIPEQRPVSPPPSSIAIQAPSTISRPLDLTPSTPASRILPPRSERSPVGGHNSPLSRTNDPHDQGMTPRDVPLALDAVIMALAALLVAVVLRRAM
ncbi:uncharacterized protein EI90DRAFT_3280220 [Cantharellus anzutake]|uniref:uncharacterized protein n=1 Tax=Cantharellus anzutake TaxID=1750568 RepID=UPI00190619FC|nr:uncharacterized protein EI90DRAFT_3280220 [Cantharellus anzutake]KAF8333980.1 hypothetical protein EI90DRAFT_3280220 [Cantharellus anzutake]